MTKLLLRDVSDGLNLLINNNGCYDLTVDFGGDKNLDRCYRFHDSFLLTHFHKDHYNGILNCQNHNFCWRLDNHHSCWHLDNFYHPVMPSFKEDKVFFLCLLAMNIRISKNHPIQSTILSLVRKLNRKPLHFIPVAKGDIFVCGNRKYEILWPPRELKEEDILKVIKSAIKDFEKAKEADSTLKDIYRNVSLQYSESNINEVNERDVEIDFTEQETSEEVTEVIQKANTSLRKAANRLSVAFRQDDNILFLGDLEKKEINFVVDDLIKQNNTSYDILISSHHGTHWGNSLKSIHCDICLASIGSTLRSHIAYDYKDISNKFVRTDEWGDIRITRKHNIK